MEIDDLEAKWEQQYDGNAFEEETGESSMVYDGEEHMELFYND